MHLDSVEFHYDKATVNRYRYSQHEGPITGSIYLSKDAVKQSGEGRPETVEVYVFAGVEQEAQQ